MSTARKQIHKVVREHPYFLGRPTVQADWLADQLMPIVRDAVARGFEEGARQLEAHPDVDDLPPALLRRWAHDARNDTRHLED
jgi:hypothetical protein